MLLCKVSALSALWPVAAVVVVGAAGVNHDGLAALDVLLPARNRGAALLRREAEMLERQAPRNVESAAAAAPNTDGDAGDAGLHVAGDGLMSTRGLTTVRKDNGNLEVEIERLEQEHSHLEDDHKTMRDEYRKLVDPMRKYFDEHPAAPRVLAITTATTTSLGWSVADLKEMRDSAKFVHESHQEIAGEADKVSAQWKLIMKHKPNVEIPAGGATHATEHVKTDVAAAPVPNG